LSEYVWLVGILWFQRLTTIFSYSNIKDKFNFLVWFQFQVNFSEWYTINNYEQRRRRGFAGPAGTDFDHVDSDVVRWVSWFVPGVDRKCLVESRNVATSTPSTGGHGSGLSYTNSPVLVRCPLWPASSSG